MRCERNTAIWLITKYCVHGVILFNALLTGTSRGETEVIRSE